MVENTGLPTEARKLGPYLRSAAEALEKTSLVIGCEDNLSWVDVVYLTIHPALIRDELPEELAACYHSMGIRARYAFIDEVARRMPEASERAALDTALAWWREEVEANRRATWRRPPVVAEPEDTGRHVMVCRGSKSKGYTCISVPTRADTVQYYDCIATRDGGASGRVVSVLHYQIRPGGPYAYRWNVLDAKGRLQTVYSGEACVLGMPEFQF